MQEELPKVSIVVPVYNMGNTIESCVKSLTGQDYPNIEIILVDDGSKDNSFEKCKELEEKNNNIKAFHTYNRGSGPARNYGIEKANGNYIYFPDADDYLETNAISILVECMQNNKCDLVVFGFKNIDTRGRLVKTKDYTFLCKDGNEIRQDYSNYMTTMSKWGIQGAPWNKFFDLGIIKRYGIEYPSLRRHQDEGFIARYMCHVQKVCFIPNVLYTYYTNDLNREWQKYPIDYIDAVIGLQQTREETILQWNDSDTKVHEMIQKEYICNVIKALELSFSPKMQFTYRQRFDWLEESIERSLLAHQHIPSILGWYQRRVMFFVKHRLTLFLYVLLHMKITIETMIRR